MMAPPQIRKRWKIPGWVEALALIIVIGSAASVGASAVEWLIFNGGPHPVVIQSVPISSVADEGAFRYPFVFRDTPAAVPDLAFADGSGRVLSLSAFRGRPIVLNIWATWCVPCRKEMPSLDRLQARFDRSKLLVLPVSIDLQGAPVVDMFYQDMGLRSLGVYADTIMGAANKLGLPGVPATLLIDAEGREIGRKLGPAEWDSPEIIEILRQRFGLSADAATTKGHT